MYGIQWVDSFSYTSRSRQYGRHSGDGHFKCIFLDESIWISIHISLKFVPNGWINNTPALIQIIDWWRLGDKPLNPPCVNSLWPNDGIWRREYGSILAQAMACCLMAPNRTGNPLHSRALAHSRAPLFTQPCPHCSHSRAPREQWARLCVFTLQGCVQAARLCRGSHVKPLPEPT